MQTFGRSLLLVDDSEHNHLALVYPVVTRNSQKSLVLSDDHDPEHHNRDRTHLDQSRSVFQAKKLGSNESSDSQLVPQMLYQGGRD